MVYIKTIIHLSVGESDGYLPRRFAIHLHFGEYLLTIEATKLQPLSQASMEQQTVNKEACKLCLNAALSQESISYIKNANYLVENLSDNGELETNDGLLLLTTST